MRVAIKVGIFQSLFISTLIKKQAMRNSWAILTIIVLAITVGGCDSKRVLNFDGDNALQLVEQQMSFGPRNPGSQGHEEVGEWIQHTLSMAGWEVEVQEFEYRGVELRNFIAKNRTQLSLAPILLGTHYDTRPRAERDIENPAAHVPGANDGASGVAVLLELARVIDPESLDFPVWLVFFDAEDSGDVEGWDWIVGSTYFVDQLQVIPQAVVIVDMVGDEKLELYYERNSDGPLQEQIWTIAKELGYTSFINEPKFALIDDHTPFILAGIPAIDIIDFDYPYWHTTKDTLDKVSADSLEAVGRTLYTWLTSIPALQP
ncbi:MAG: M28 family peptidase [Anaerolineales bacterium]|nr:M28 family peptidase [Anaerolineales bacterium]